MLVNMRNLRTAIAGCLAVTSLTAGFSPAVYGARALAPGETSQILVVPMKWKCDEFSEADRKRATSEGLGICGATSSGHDARGANTMNCGTALIYVSQSGGKAKVAYALHSTVGIIYFRSLSVWWGPTAAGSKVDIGSHWGTAFSGEEKEIGYAMNRRKFGATISGTVAIFGWTAGCVVYANDPVHAL